MPPPVPYGDETLVNTTTTNAQKVPQVTALANGTYVVVWQDASTAAPDNSPDSIRAQIFHADGTPLGSEFVPSEFPFAFQQDPVVTALPDGRFVAAWESFNHALQDQSGSHISARIFNPDGTPSTAEFQVNTHTDFWQTKPAIATLDTGGFVITWMHDFVGGNVNYDIFARVYGADGQPIAAEDRGVDISTGVIERAPVVTGLPGGKFVIAWEDSGSASQTDGSGSHIRAMIYTGNFQPLNGPSFVVNSTTVNNQSDPSIATLSNGNFVVGWTHQFSASDDDVRGRVFNGNGVAQSTNFGIDTSGTPVRETQSSITALSNGQYFAVWRDSGGTASGQTDGSGSHIRGAVLSGNGTAVSGQFIINTTSNGSQGEPTVSRLADGRVIVAWTDFGLNAGDTSGAAVRSQILDPRTAAVTLADSGGNDEWVGTAFADTMKGGGGADILDGAGSDDVLTGGTGADTLDGGLGNDTLDGSAGAGGDTASYASAMAGVTVSLSLAGQQDTVGAGNDTLNEIERLTGSEFDDTLAGNGGNNVLDGRGGNDLLEGASGNDSLIGGAGMDTATYASAGAAVKLRLSLAGQQDTLGAGKDTLSEIENLTGSAFADALTGDAAVNVLKGGADDDVLDGNGGGDTLIGNAGNDTASYASAAAGVMASLANPPSNTGDAAGDTYASIETLMGSAFDDVLTGNGDANTVNGGKGADQINGAGGVDRLLGGGGLDTLAGGGAGDVFVFDQALVAGNLTTIVDLAAGSDAMELSLTIFAAAGAAGSLSASAFRTGAAAADASDRIIYNSLTGALLYDADGADGVAAKTFATVSTGLGLTATDFQLVA